MNAQYSRENIWPAFTVSSQQLLPCGNLALCCCCIIWPLIIWPLIQTLDLKIQHELIFPLLQMQRNKMAFCTTQMLFLALNWFLDPTQNFNLFWSCCRFSWVLGLTAVLLLSCGASACQKCGISPLVSIAFLISSLHTTSLYHLFFSGLSQNTSYANLHLESSFLLAYF